MATWPAPGGRAAERPVAGVAPFLLARGGRARVDVVVGGRAAIVTDLTEFAAMALDPASGTLIVACARGLVGIARDGTVAVIGDDAPLCAAAGLSVAGCVAFVSSGADSAVYAVRLDDGRVSRLAGQPRACERPSSDGSRESEMDARDGTGDDAVFLTPAGLAALEREAVVYVADTDAHAVRRVCVDWRALDASTARVETVCGTGAAGRLDGAMFAARLSHPESVLASADGQQLYVGERAAVRLVDLASGQVRTVFASPLLYGASALVHTALRALVITDAGGSQLFCVNEITGYAERLQVDDGWSEPSAVVILDDGTMLVGEGAADRIRSTRAPAVPMRRVAAATSASEDESSAAAGVGARCGSGTDSTSDIEAAESDGVAAARGDSGWCMLQ